MPRDSQGNELKVGDHVTLSPEAQREMALKPVLTITGTWDDGRSPFNGSCGFSPGDFAKGRTPMQFEMLLTAIRAKVKTQGVYGRLTLGGTWSNRDWRYEVSGVMRLKDGTLQLDALIEALTAKVKEQWAAMEIKS